MNIKSLLCTAALLSVCGVTYAFPSYTLYPADGSTLDSNLSLGNFNLTFGSSDEIVVSDGAEASLENEEQGDFISSTRVGTFPGMGGVLIVNFDSDEIVVNGTWNLEIPAGTFTVNGEENPVIRASYDLNDRNLNISEYPQIELVSIDPEEGSKLPFWGGPDFTQLRIKTTDDSAVNYMEWVLYDVTNGEEEGVREYIHQGNDNRYDPNRYGGDESDLWADGLFCAIGGDTKLLLDHKYMLTLRCAGIGYDLATNQYPSGFQIEQSTEMFTKVYYYGAIPPQEYSPYKLESISPDPENYEITNPDLGYFEVTYSGPVKPVKFEYFVMTSVNASAGTYEAIDPNEDGYASKWTFTFDKSVIESARAGIFVTISAMDADGLYVRGNANMDFDDINYSMNWQCNCGADVVISLSPEASSVVEELSSITVGNEEGKRMNFSYLTSEPAQIVSMEREVIRELGEPVNGEDGTTMIWNFEPITEPGTYVLMIPKGYFNIGEEYDGTNSNATQFTYYVEGVQTGELAYDWVPSSITPADNATLNDLSVMVLDFENVTFADFEAVASVYKVEETEDVFVTEATFSDNANSDYWNPTIYDLTLKTPVSEFGTYKVVIPAASFGDGQWFETRFYEAVGRTNPEIVLVYNIGSVGVDSILSSNENATVYNIQGVEVLRDADASAVKALPAGLYIINGEKVVVGK